MVEKIILLILTDLYGLNPPESKKIVFVVIFACVCTYRYAHERLDRLNSYSAFKGFSVMSKCL
jgi:hypothetical protein